MIPQLVDYHQNNQNKFQILVPLNSKHCKASIAHKVKRILTVFNVDVILLEWKL